MSAPDAYEQIVVQLPIQVDLLVRVLRALSREFPSARIGEHEAGHLVILVPQLPDPPAETI